MATRNVTYAVYSSHPELHEKITEVLKNSRKWWKFYTEYYGDKASEPVTEFKEVSSE